MHVGAARSGQLHAGENAPCIIVVVVVVVVNLFFVLYISNATVIPMKRTNVETTLEYASQQLRSLTRDVIFILIQVRHEV